MSNTTESKFDPTVVEKRLRDAADAYYNGQPHLSDADYDELWNLHKAERERNPDHPVYKDTILDKVGHSPRAESGFEKRKHSAPMLSLDNAFVGEDGGLDELTGWLKNIATVLGENTRIILEPKIDGASLRLTYVDGFLEKAVTRGDGEVGDDVTANMVNVRGVPQRIEDSHGTREFNGEVFMTFETFRALNAERQRNGDETYSNPRNAASGILQRHDPTKVVGLSFLAHGIVNPRLSMYAHEVARIQEAGKPDGLTFPASCAVLANGHGTEQWSGGEDLKKFFEGLCDYPIDGVVFKVDAFDQRSSIGVTSRAPRWAVALKFAQETKETTLNGITVQVGRSGVLTPVAELEPVELDGSVVSRASLHNEPQVNRLGAEVGDTVAVRKAGAIIPEVVRSVTFDKLTNLEQDQRGMFSLLDHIDHRCPSCGGSEFSLKFEEKEGGPKIYVCTNVAGCPAQLAARIEYMAGRDCLDINQMGGEVCDEIAFRAGLEDIRHPFDVLEQPTGWFAALSWTTPAGGKMTFGEGRAKKVTEAILRAKRLPLNRWIAALGLRTIGKNTSKEITRLCRTRESILAACTHPDGVFRQMVESHESEPGKKLYEAHKERFGISARLGPVSLGVLVRFVQSPAGERLIKRIPAAVESDNYNPEPPKEKDGPLAGKTFVITGTLSVPRTAIKQLIEDAGGTVTGSISGKTSVLVAGEKAGSKRAKAEKLGVEIWDEDTLRGEVSS